MIHTTFWLNAYSIIKVFSLSTTFVERISGLGEDFVLLFFQLCFTHTDEDRQDPWSDNPGTLSRASTNLDKQELTAFKIK